MSVNLVGARLTIGASSLEKQPIQLMIDKELEVVTFSIMNDLKNS